MTAGELLEAIKRLGGVLELDGDRLRCLLPKDAIRLTDWLREHKNELIGILQARGGRIANFPRCPNCASYALYRKDNIGNYECLTCGCQNVAEEVARSTH